MKILVTPAGIELAIFRFVAQHLNHCATEVLLTVLGYNNMNGMRSYDLVAALIFQDPEITYFNRSLKDIHYFLN